MKTLHKTFFLAAVLSLGLAFAPAPQLQAGERIIIDAPFFAPGLYFRGDHPYPRHRHLVPARSYVYGPSYYYGDRYRGDDGPRFYRDRYYDDPRYYRDRDRFYDERRYYRDRGRDRYYDRDNYRRYREEERVRRDTYREQRIPKEQKTMQERRWSR